MTAIKLEDRQFTAREVAKRLKVSTTTVYAMLRNGELPYTIEDGIRLIAYRDLYEVPVRRRGHPVTLPAEERPTTDGHRRRVQAARATDAEMEAWTRAAEKKHGGLIGPWLRDVANAAASASAEADEQAKKLLIEAVKGVEVQSP